jgi:transcriptional regulator with XRE-family HTH domain
MRQAETLGERLRRLRRERGLTQCDLAETGVSEAHISRIESGSRRPSIPVIRRLARSLGVSPEYLESGVEISPCEELELRLSDMELQLHLEPEEESAGQELQAIIELAEEHGEADLAARARALLGIACAGWGRLSDAATLLDRALAHPLMRPELFTEAHLMRVRTYGNLGRLEEAVELCEQALADVPQEAEAARMMLATELSQRLSDLGEFARAERVLRELSLSGANADPYARARMHWSLARVAAMQDKRRLALRHMRLAIAILRGTEDTVHLARAHYVCAQILLWGGETEGAGDYLEAAAALFPANADPSDRGAIKAFEALLAAREGHFAIAAELARLAFAILGQNENPKAAAWYAKALAEAGCGRFASADHGFARALELLEKSSLWREASLVSLDRARVLEQAGRREAGARWRARAEEFSARAKRGAVGSLST